MSQTVFDDLAAAIDSGGVETAFSNLKARLLEEKKYHDLFDARLMESRHELGLPIILTTSLDDLEDPMRTQVEDAYLDACKEVGHLLLKEGRLREAWMYLRPTGERAEVAAALEKMEPNEENMEELIEVAIQEGVAPRRGFEFVLQNYGICNAITMFDGGMSDRPRKHQQDVAGLLVRTLHEELTANLKAEIARQAGSEPTETSIKGLVAERDWLFNEDAYHIDTSHLHSVTRFARLLDDEDALRLALDMTEYGRRLSPQYQYQTEEPFAETYKAHALFFQGKLGENTEEALSYFKNKAETLDGRQHGSGPAEVYVVLLDSLGQHREALEQAALLIPGGAQTSGFAPTLFELAKKADAYERLMEICQEREDVLGYTAGLVVSKSKVGS